MKRAIRGRAGRAGQTDTIVAVVPASPVMQKYYTIACIAILLALGAYHSVLYFGHQAVPNSDWPCFTATGHQMLSFSIPTDYKRTPVLGTMQVALSKLMGGPYPELTASWLLNGILHTLSMVLFWLIARKIIGRAAIWFAVLAGINPYVIDLLRTPIVETALLFFILLTAYSIVIRSKWSYLLAAITSMVRYEGAVFILIAFIMDLAQDRSKRNIAWAVLRGFLASIPIGLWMLGTFLNWKSQESMHYLKDIGGESGGRIVWLEYIELIWQSGFEPLFTPATQDRNTAETVIGLGKMIVLIGFAFGSIYAIAKRNLDIILLLVFFVPYIAAHALHGVLLGRYCMPVNWMAMLIVIYGWYAIWGLVNRNGRVPRAMVAAFGGLVLIVALLWGLALFGYLGEIARFSERSVSMPFVTIGAALLLTVAGVFLEAPRSIWRNVVIFIVIAFFAISNQFSLAGVVGNGKQDIEFKYLAEWYVKNAKPGEKLVTSMSGVVEIFAPQYKANFIHIVGIGAKDPDEFVQRCLKNKITYVVWDSRIGVRPNDRYYKLWRIDNIAMLSRPRDNGPYQYIATLTGLPDRYVHIFRLNPQATLQSQ